MSLITLLLFCMPITFVFIILIRHYLSTPDKQPSPYANSLITTSGRYYDRVLQVRNYLVYCMVDQNCNIANFPYSRSNPQPLRFVFVSFTIQKGELLTMCTACNPLDQNRSRILDVMWKPNELLHLTDEQVGGIFVYLKEACSKRCIHAEAINQVPLGV